MEEGLRGAPLYKDQDLNCAAVVDVLRLAETGELVGMVATICHFGAADTKDRAAHEKTKMRREHRVVVLPAWQGLGVGPALSNLSAELWTATAHGDPVKTARPLWRYTSTTSHPRFGSYRDANDLWKPTSGNGRDGRYCHEYAGLPLAGAKRRIPIADTEGTRPCLDRASSSQPTLLQAFSRTPAAPSVYTASAGSSTDVG